MESQKVLDLLDIGQLEDYCRDWELTFRKTLNTLALSYRPILDWWESAKPSSRVVRLVYWITRVPLTHSEVSLELGSEIGWKNYSAKWVFFTCTLTRELIPTPWDEGAVWPSGVTTHHLWLWRLWSVSSPNWNVLYFMCKFQTVFWSFHIWKKKNILLTI